MTNVQIIRPKTRFDLWYVVRRMFAQEELEQIVEQMEKLPLNTGRTLAGTDSDYRDSYIKWVPQYDQSNWKWLYYRIWKWAKIANDDNWHFDIEGFQDNPQYTMYNGEGSKYDWHTDLGGDGIDHRKISMSLLIEDCTEGGVLEFKRGKENTPIDLKAGDAVFFPSWLMHRVTPVVSGNRTSLVSWISGKPFK